MLKQNVDVKAATSIKREKVAKALREVEAQPIYNVAAAKAKFHFSLVSF